MPHSRDFPITAILHRIDGVQTLRISPEIDLLEGHAAVDTLLRQPKLLHKRVPLISTVNLKQEKTDHY